MKAIQFSLYSALLAILVSSSVSGTPEAIETSAPVDTTQAIYVVAQYDPDRNPQEDLNSAITLAQKDGKRILLEVGGEWCSWCHALDRYIYDNQTVSEKLRKDFLIIKINYSEENANEAFLSQYPEIPGYPHIFVLESDGAFLHSQGTAELEEGKSYSESAFMQFLNTWSPQRE